MVYAGRVLAIAVVYFLTAKMGLLFTLEIPHVTMIWPPSGIALAALLMFGMRFWPGVLLGALAVNIFSGIEVPLIAVLAASAGSTLEAVLGTFILRKFGFNGTLERVRDVAALIICAGVLSTTVSAVLGATSLCLGGAVSWGNFSLLFWRWWVGDAASIWSITPLILTWSARPYSPGKRIWETVAVFLLLASVSYIALADSAPEPMKFLVFPFLAWSALRLGQRKTAMACAVVTAMAIWGVQHGSHAFAEAGADPVQRLGMLILFLGVSNSTALSLGAVAAERAQAIAAHEQDEAQLYMALDAGRMGIWEWDVPSGEICWSENLEAIHGLAKGGGPRNLKDYLEGIHPDDRERVKATVMSALTNKSFSMEYRPANVQAGLTWFAARGTTFYDDSGNPVRMIGLCADISQRKCVEEERQRASQELERQVVDRTLALRELIGTLNVEIEERKRTELALRESEQRLRLLTDQLPAILFTLDKGMRVRTLTGAGLAVLNIKKEPVLRQPMAKYLETDDPDYPPIKAARRALNGNIESVEVEWHGHYYRSHFRPLRDIAGKIIGCVGMAVDVTEYEHMKAALEEDMRRKDDFLAMLAHELRNPLAPIRNASQMLQKNGGKEENVRRLGEVIDRQVAHMAHLIDDLLDIARISHGRIFLQKQRVELMELLRETIDEHSPEIAKKKLELAATLPPEKYWVEADPTRLTQIFDNLIQNAAKFTPPGGRITVEVGLDGNYVTVAVRDTGIGLEPTIKEKLFQPFFQANQSLDRSVGGLGLGLAVVKRLIELHCGRIEAFSAGVGQGAEFKLWLPRVEPLASQQIAVVEKFGEALKILIVEDNVDAAESLGLLLESFGHQTRIAYDGFEGLQAAHTFFPDVIICDIGLPKGMNGYEFATQFCRDKSMHTAFLIAMSGYGQARDKERAREAGFNLHLTKPVDFAELKHVLTADIESWRLARSH